MKLLVFGGNGYIGGECVHYLLGKGHEITLLNRGHWPWDSVVRLRPHVYHVYCDRYDPKSVQSLEHDLADKKFDAVIDFSATETARVQPFYELLKKRVKLYVYISSDSCYEVCDKKRDGPSKEEDAVRPTDEKLRAELASKDAYGNGKMCVEEFLMQEQKKGGLPYVFLRLADVLGERDTTERWWKYQMWMEHQKTLGVPVIVPRFTEHLFTSYVDVLDVASVIQLILASGDRVFNQAYNVALKDPLRLIDLLRIIQKATGTEVDLKFHDGEFAFPSVRDAPTGALRVTGDFYFPSVTRGPIDLSKITSELGWAPPSKKDFESWRAKQIAEFYRGAKRQFPNERSLVAESLLDDLHQRIKPNVKERFLQEVIM